MCITSVVLFSGNTCQYLQKNLDCLQAYNKYSGGGSGVMLLNGTSISNGNLP